MWIGFGLTLTACVMAAGVSIFAASRAKGARASCWRAVNLCDMHRNAALHIVAHQDFAIEDLIELKRADMEVRPDGDSRQTIPAVAGDSDPQVPTRPERVAATA